MYAKVQKNALEDVKSAAVLRFSEKVLFDDLTLDSIVVTEIEEDQWLEASMTADPYLKKPKQKK